MAGKTLIYVGAEAQGLYRKEAGDDDWEMLTDGMPPLPQARAIAIHPQDPSIIFVGTQRGVYKSQDRGDHWRRLNLTEGRIVWSIKFHPHNPQVMFLGTEGSELFKSEDGGENWQYVGTISNPDSVQMAFATRIMGIGIESANPDNMYAAMEVGGAARSTDGGKTWDIVNKNMQGDVRWMDQHGVAVAPDSGSVFLSNRTGVWRSKDKGVNWESLQFEKFSSIRYSRGVQIAPNDPNTMYACVGQNSQSGGEGGVLRSTDQGETWHPFYQGVTPSSTTCGVSINAKQPEQVYFCTRKGQVFGTQDGGSTWQEHHTLPETATNVSTVACTSA